MKRHLPLCGVLLGLGGLLGANAVGGGKGLYSLSSTPKILLEVVLLSEVGM